VEMPCLSTVRHSAGKVTKIMSQGARATVVRGQPTGCGVTSTGSVGVTMGAFSGSGVGESDGEPVEVE
jgi:hypothetical protein